MLTKSASSGVDVTKQWGHLFADSTPVPKFPQTYEEIIPQEYRFFLNCEVLSKTYTTGDRAPVICVPVDRRQLDLPADDN